MKTFKQFMEGGYVKKVGEPVDMKTLVKGIKIIDDTETNPLRKQLRLIRLGKSSPLKGVYWHSILFSYRVVRVNKTCCKICLMRQSRYMVLSLSTCLAPL